MLTIISKLKNIIKKYSWNKKQLYLCLFILMLLITLTAHITYSRFAKTINLSGTSNVPMHEYCKLNNISNFRECLIRSDSYDELSTSLSNIETRTSNVNFNNVATSSSSLISGLVKGEDDYTTYTDSTPTDNFTYYYRGNVNNNWVSFGGFLWRIIRINGDGSIRMIYSGTESSNHTGNNALITTSTGTKLTSFGDTTEYTTPYGTTYTNGKTGSTHVGYMYNPKFTVYTMPNDNPISSSNRIYNYPYKLDITASNEFYFFTNFDKNTDCDVGSDSNETGTCTLKCNDLGDDCIKTTWASLYNDSNNFDTDPNNGATDERSLYTNLNKYTCWTQGTAVEHDNGDGTTSVYISCPVVSEVLGIDNNQSDKAVVKYHGLFSESKTVSESNIKDSNAKYEVDYWYEHNILNQYDDNNNLLEDYLSDEIFCNDRTNSGNGYKLTTNGNSMFYYPITRIQNTIKPSFKCTNLSNDGFTLQTTSVVSSVTPSNDGNNKLKYPVGLITADEVLFAGGKWNTINRNYYLQIGSNFHTMSPSLLYNGSANSIMLYVGNNGSINHRVSNSKDFGLRPVINLSSDVLYSSGIGIESSPYVVKLNE